MKARQLFDQLTGQLLGSDQTKPLVTRRTILTYFALTFGIALVLVLRRVDAITNPQFWAEDGAIVFRNTVLFSFKERLLSDIYGFPYLLPKLIGQFAKPFGFEAAPLLYSLAADVLVGLMIAVFSLPHFKHIINSDRLRIVFCLLVVSLPNSGELVSVAINLCWYIGIWAILVAFIYRPASWWATALLAATHFLFIYSSPASIIVAPIWLLRLMRGGLHRDRKEIALALAVLATIASLILLTGDLGSSQVRSDNARFSLAAAFNFLTTRVFSEAIVGTGGVEYLRTHIGAQAVIWITGLALVGLLVVSWFTRFKNAVLSLTFLGILLVYLIFTLVGRLGLNPYGENLQALSLSVGGRYFVIGNVLVFLVCLLSLDRLKPTRFKTELIMAVLAGMVWVVSQTFGISIFQDYNWPKYASQLREIQGHDDRPALIVPINPAPFTIVFNDDRENVEKIPAEDYLPGLGQGTTYAQTFKSSCAHLSSVSLFFATYKQTEHNPVALELTDTTTGKVVTQQTLSANSIKDDSWQPIYFSPVADSLNHTFRLTISLAGPLPGKSVTVYTSKTDKYPAGQGFLNDAPIKGDLVFHYACRIPITIS